jgi:hypothetical protein
LLFFPPCREPRLADVDAHRGNDAGARPHHSIRANRAKGKTVLPNGNTLITEGSNGRIFEITRDHELVWEYISPYWVSRGLTPGMNMIYRAYRAPYTWVPQRPAPTETPIPRLDRSGFRVPGAAPPGREREISVPGVAADQQDAAFCVAPLGNAP